MKIRAVDFVVTEFDTRPVAFALDGAPLDPGLPATTVAFAVDDVAVSVEELRQKGVTVLVEPFESPVCFLAVIADPDRNPVCLHKRKDGTAG